MVSVLLLAGAFGLFQWMLAAGRSEAVARTVTANVFVFVQIFYLLNCRSLTRSLFHVRLFSNPWVWLGIAGMTLLQLLSTYTGPMIRLFESSPILPTDWILILSGGMIRRTAPNFHYFADDLERVRASLGRILALSTHRLWLGHGGPLGCQEVASWYRSRFAGR